MVTDSSFSHNDSSGIGGIGTVTVTNCTFTKNTCRNGAGILVHDATLTVTNCVLSDNSATVYGGAITGTLSTVTVLGSTLSGNLAGEDGGAISCNSSTLTVANSTLSGNAAEGYGGGIDSFGSGEVTVRDCTIEDCSAGSGAGIYSTNSVSTTITRAVFSRNSGSVGGGIRCDTSGTTTIVDSAFLANSARRGGGIDNAGVLTITNCTLSGNSVEGYGGALFHDSGTLTIVNCTLSENSAGSGGGIYLYGSSSETILNNSIAAGNTATAGPDVYRKSGTLTGSHSLIGDGSGQSSLHNGSNGNRVGTTSSPIDPGLSDLSRFDNGLWGCYLLPGSPALDTGDNSLAIDPSGEPLTEDLAGNTRVQNGTVDIGAVEGATTGNSAQTYLVTSLENTIANDGVLTFIEAFEAANGNLPVGDAPAGSFSERDFITFANGLEGTVLLEDGELPVTSDLSILGPETGSVVFQANGRNRVFSVWSIASVDLEGVTITGGSACDGGGIYNSMSSTVTVTDCTVSGNSARNGNGGGISNTGTMIVVNCTFGGNSADDNGGGIYNSGTLTVTNSTLSGNLAYRGGGFYGLNTSATTLNNTIVAGNLGLYGPDVYHIVSGILSGSCNLIGDGSGQSTLIDGTDGNLVGTPSSPIDPGLSDWSRFANGRWGHYLLPGSPALDAGDNSLVIDASGQPLTEDIAGNARIQNATIDIGALEGMTTDYPAQIYIVASLENIIADDGIVTFLEAFEAANRNQAVGDAPAGSFTEQDTIEFADGISGTILVDRGTLMVPGNLAIEGPGADDMAFQADGRNGVFSVWPCVSASLDGVTITGGSTDQGGGLRNSGTLSVTDSVFSANSSGYGGGGIYNSFMGSLTITNCEVSDNSVASLGNGSGIHNDGILTVTNSALSDNSANLDGGAIHNSSSGVLSVAGCVLTDNQAENYGGAIYNSGTLIISNSTFSDNSAIYGNEILNDGTLTMTNSMISNNTYSSGSAIYSSGELTVTDSIISGNSSSSSAVSNYSSSLTVTGCAITGNSGNGIYNSSGTVTVMNSMLSDNTGSGIYSTGSSTLSVTNSTISGNSASGVYHSGGTVALTDCTISGNSGNQGGGIYSGSSTLSVTDCTISGNTAGSSYGGGIYGSGLLTVTRSTISGNSAGRGGGIYASEAAIVDSFILDNSADYEGGGIYHYTGTLSIANSTISGNSAKSGGGIYNQRTLSVTNSTIMDNLAVQYGGGIAHVSSLMSTLNNTIVAANAAEQGPDIYHPSNRLSGFCNLIGDGSDQMAFVDGTNGNLVGTEASPIDPLLSDLHQFDNGLWGYCPMPGSPVLDAGDNGLALDPSGQALTEDIAGNDRIQNDTVDMGAVEGTTAGSPAQTYVVTSLDDTIATDGVLTFREAFEASNRNQPVGDAPAGSFTEQDVITFVDGLSGTVWVDDGELLVTGDLSIEGPGADLLTFHANGQNRVFSKRQSVSVELHGITITGGSAESGGGIFAPGALTVNNCVISGNSATKEGGGIYTWYGPVTLTDSTVSGNTAYDGGGIYNDSGTLHMAYSVVSGNSVEADGGGIINSHGTLTITNCTLLGNSTGRFGVGGAILNYSGTLIVTNSTIAHNTAFLSGSGLHNSGSSSIAMLYNTIVAANDWYDISSSSSSSTLLGFHNLIGNGLGQSALVDGVDGNLVGTYDTPIDPMLDAQGMPLVGSPAINAGSNELAVDDQGNPLLTDLGGLQRVLYGRVDIGAYEFRLTADANFDGHVDAEDAGVLGTHWLMRENACWEDGDFNGDGRVDDLDASILAANWGARALPLIPGDANDDGTVDAADARILAEHWLSEDDVSWDDGDFNGDGRVDDLDASIMAANWGSSVTEGNAVVRPQGSVVVERERIVGPRRLEAAGLVAPTRMVLGLTGRSQSPVEGAGVVKASPGAAVRPQLRGLVHDVALAELFGRSSGGENGDSSVARRKVGPLVRPVVELEMMEK
ncbi:MAG: right-handed parallel beta-helix repeat-containing protein [Pirellulales bacterium]|nr:right-handed parallel beta-helix repeat-containing protein [Pirellulales bacterium]